MYSGRFFFDGAVYRIYGNTFRIAYARTVSLIRETMRNRDIDLFGFVMYKDDDSINYFIRMEYKAGLFSYDGIDWNVVKTMEARKKESVFIWCGFMNGGCKL